MKKLILFVGLICLCETDVLAKSTTSGKTSENAVVEPGFINAVKDRDPGKIKKEWKKLNKKNVDGRDSADRTALITVAAWNYGGMVDKLVKLGADPNAVDRKKQTALMKAAEYTSSAMIKSERESDIKTNLEIIKSLLAHKRTKVNLVDENGETVLIKAVKNGKTEMIKLLLDRGADVNIADGSGYTPLMLAAFRGYTDVVELLLAKGARVNELNPYGETALMQAVQMGHYQVVVLLLSAGANIAIKNRRGQTVRDMISRSVSRRSVEEIYWLIKKKWEEEKKASS